MSYLKLLPLLLLIVFIQQPISAQVSEPTPLYTNSPGIDWTSLWWWKSSQVQQTDSGEDWWYSHINAYENGEHAGTGCFDPGTLNLNTTSCGQLITPGHVLGFNRQAWPTSIYPAG